tara:strand:- start:158 stop:481 length:324 start_codon:yes stop_codon:yes gene_type:complete
VIYHGAAQVKKVTPVTMVLVALVAQETQVVNLLLLSLMVLVVEAGVVTRVHSMTLGDALVTVVVQVLARLGLLQSAMIPKSLSQLGPRVLQTQQDLMVPGVPMVMEN